MKDGDESLLADEMGGLLDALLKVRCTCELCDMEGLLDALLKV